MRKKRVLFVSEAPWYSTGYSVYTKEVLNRLHQDKSLECAQLGIYADASNHNLNSFPWKIYPNKPLDSDKNLSAYKNNPSAQFGDYSFNDVLLQFKPDIVIDIRDWWMIEFEQRSPFRDFYHWAIMPTVDAEPQANQWVNTYASADAVFTYSEFGRDVLRSQCDNINFIDVASPSAGDAFNAVEDKAQHKINHGLSPDCTIVGTVMRNQKRKLYPDLFESFRKFLDNQEKSNIYLYCHTYYPDIGWDIPQLLADHSLSNRVLFSYKCKNCGAVSSDFFQDSIQYCKNVQNLIISLLVSLIL